MKSQIKSLLKKTEIIIAMFIMITTLLSCSSKESEMENEDSSDMISTEVRQLDYDVEEPLIVFCEMDNGILMNFTNQYPNIPLEIHEIGWGGLEDMDDDIALHGEPDIIIATNLLIGDNGRLDRWYQEGYIEGLGKYIDADYTIFNGEYIPGTFEIISNEEDVFGIPLSWETRCLIISESQWEGSELAYLPEDYTGEELYTALLHEVKKNREEGERFWAFTFSDLLDDIYEMGAVYKDESGEVVIDEEFFALSYELRLRKNISDPTFFMGTDIVNPAFDPDYLGGEYLGTTLEGAPQITAVYGKSGAAFKGDDARLMWIPTVHNANEYIGEVKDIALIGGKSAKKQQAYDVIRLMMDMPIDLIKVAGFNNSPQTYSPVNVERALELLETMNSGTTQLQVYNTSGMLCESIERKNLSEVEMENIREMIRGMGKLDYQANGADLYSIYTSYEMAHREGDDINHRQCYFEIMRALNPDSEKWDLTPEEIKAFVNEAE